MARQCFHCFYFSASVAAPASDDDDGDGAEQSAWGYTRRRHETIISMVRKGKLPGCLQ